MEFATNRGSASTIVTVISTIGKPSERRSIVKKSIIMCHRSDVPVIKLKRTDTRRL